MSALEASQGHEPWGPSFSTLLSKSRGRIVSFYYNCWKTRALPQARDWYSRLQQVRPSLCHDAVGPSPRMQCSAFVLLQSLHVPLASPNHACWCCHAAVPRHAESARSATCALELVAAAILRVASPSQQELTEQRWGVQRQLEEAEREAAWDAPGDEQGEGDTQEDGDDYR